MREMRRARITTMSASTACGLWLTAVEVGIRAGLLHEVLHEDCWSAGKSCIIFGMSQAVEQPEFLVGLSGPYAWAYRHRIRLWSGFLLLMFVPMLGIGLYLKPSTKGLATHTQLGLPPCGFYTEYGWPCPTCGYTTAVTHVAHGQW